MLRVMRIVLFSRWFIAYDGVRRRLVQVQPGPYGAGLKARLISVDRLDMRPVGLVILLLLLIPSAAYLWLHDDLPQFCDFHDDCVYYVSAKSLADGGGYRVESLPGEPPQTKYPPLYPLLLSVAWRLDPNFPHNVPIAA